MKPKIDLPPVDEVVLPKLFNLRPGYYILGLIILALLLIIFFIGFYPGIVKGGRYVSFQAPLSDSGILLNGTYLGSSTHQYFIPSGKHTITYVKADQVYAEEELVIDHPLFFTWLIHRTKRVDTPTITLTENQKQTILTFDLNEIQEISKSTEYSMQFPYQEGYKALHTDLQALGIEDSELIALATSLISNETMREDAERFFTVAEPSSVPLQANTLPPIGKKSSLTLNDYAIEGYAYQGSSFIMGDNASTQSMAVAVTTPTFVLATRPVSQYEWALFLEENPQWTKANQKNSDLVDDSYLAGLAVSTQFSTNRPVFAISYYAAEAFVQWLSEKTNKEVFIPTEAMYSQAAYSQEYTHYDTSLALSANSTPLLGLRGGVWEMTSSHYLPQGRTSEYETLQTLAQRYGLTPQVIVKGGSTVNTNISIDAVGIIEPTSCGDYIGFRIGWFE